MRSRGPEGALEHEEKPDDRKGRKQCFFFFFFIRLCQKIKHRPVLTLMLGHASIQSGEV